MSRRSEQLKAVAQELCRVHDKWAADENREYPDEAYWDAVDDLRKVFEAGDMPEDCRELAVVVESFLDEVDVFDDRENVADLNPHKAFWEMREALATALQPPKPPDYKPLEPIAQLVTQGVSQRQIALIYGFKDRHGELMPALVQAEIDKPGSVLKTAGAVDGRDWVDPRVAEAQQAGKAATAAGERAERKRNGSKGKASSEPAASNEPPCPETPKELWSQNVSLRQASLMLRKPIEEVETLFAEFDAERDAELAGGTGAGDATTQAIRQLAAAGKKPTEIAKELKVDPKKVQEALKPAGATA